METELAQFDQVYSPDDRKDSDTIFKNCKYRSNSEPSVEEGERVLFTR